MTDARQIRMGVVVLIIIVGLLPYAGIGVPQVDITPEPIPEDVEVSWDYGWASFTDDVGDLRGKVQLQVTNHGDEPVIIRADITPVDEYGVFQNEHTVGPKIIEPDETKTYTSKWSRHDQNIDDWERMEIEIYVCEGRGIPVVYEPKCEMVTEEYKP